MDVTNSRKLLDALLRDKSVEELLYDYLTYGGGELTLTRNDSAIYASIPVTKGTKSFSNPEGTSKYAVREAVLTVIMDKLLDTKLPQSGKEK